MRTDGYANLWLCRQVDTYLCGGIREYDVDIRVVRGIEKTPEMEADVRLRFDAWWDMAVKEE